MNQHIQLANSIAELPVLAAQIEELGTAWAWPAALRMHINLVLEEAVSNIILYGFPNQENQTIDIHLTQEDSDLSIRIEDRGIPFDPTAAESPDIHLAPEDRPVGGLGIFLIAKLMDEVAYERKDGKNTLNLKKKIQ